MTDTQPTALDLDFVRGQFPAFSVPELSGMAFFENAGGSYMCRQAIDRLDLYYAGTRVQPYGHYPASKQAGELMDAAHARLARYLNVGVGEVSFGPSTSQNTYVLAQALLKRMEPGQAIVASLQDHEANSGVWRRLEQEGADVRIWPVDPDQGRLHLQDLTRLMDGNVAMVAVTHCSNIVGEVNPVAEVADIAHRAGAILLVDGVSYCPHGLPDVDSLGADIYLFSTYKTYGPHQGAMVIRETARERLEPQAHFFNHGDPAKWMVPAGPDHAQVAAVNGMIDYFDAVDSHHGGADDGGRPRRVEALFHGAEAGNINTLLRWLRGRNGIRLIGPSDGAAKAPTIAFTSTRTASGEVADALAAAGIMAGSGHFYAYRLMEALGIDPGDGVVRLSFLHYTTPGEIDRCIDALKGIV